MIEALIACEQSAAGIALAERLLRRYWPKKPSPHGFYSPEGFFYHLEEQGRRRAFTRSLVSYCCERVRNRDKAKPLPLLLKQYHLEHFT